MKTWLYFYIEHTVKYGKIIEGHKAGWAVKLRGADQ